MFCVVAVTVVGLLDVEGLLKGLDLSAVTKFWCLDREGLLGVLFVGARVWELRLDTVWLWVGSGWHWGFCNAYVAGGCKEVVRQLDNCKF